MNRPAYSLPASLGNVAQTLAQTAAELRGFIRDTGQLANYRHRHLAELAKRLEANAGVLQRLADEAAGQATPEGGTQ